MIWKKHRVLICLCALFALCLGSFVFTHSSVSALDTGLVDRQGTTVERIVRNSWGTVNIENNTNVGGVSLPWLALGANDSSSSYRYLWGMLLYNDLTSYGYNYEDYTSLHVSFALGGMAGRKGARPIGYNQPDIFKNFLDAASIIVYDNHNNSKEVLCEVNYMNLAPNGDWDYQYYYTCDANLDPSHYPVGYHIKFTPFDNVSNSDGKANFYLFPNDPRNLGFLGIAQQIISDNDPLKGLIREGNVISQNIYDSTTGIYTTITNYYQAQSEQDLQDRQNLQNASNATADGNSATSNAQNASSSILNVITGVYNVLLHPTTTNCVLSNVQIYDMNLGNLDFCTGFDIPQPIFAIGALIMVGLIILLAWSILHAGLGLYNQIFGGKT